MKRNNYVVSETTGRGLRQYRESQIGDLCRMHALNAFFQKPQISQSAFAQYVRDYSQYWKVRGFEGVTSGFDTAELDQSNLVMYILKLHGYTTRHFASTEFKSTNVTRFVEENKSPFVFLYTADHIWGVNRYRGEWYILDSMRPIRNIGRTFNCGGQTIGAIVPVHPMVELKRAVGMLRKVITANCLSTKADMNIYLEQHPPLGDLGVPVAIIITMLNQIGASSARGQFEVVNQYKKVELSLYNNTLTIIKVNYSDIVLRLFRTPLIKKF